MDIGDIKGVYGVMGPLQAKQQLWCVVNKVKKRLLVKFKNRSTANRPDADANVDDIIKALLHMDTQGVQDFLFVSQHLKNVPNPPEEINELSMPRRIESVEKKNEVLENGDNHTQI